MPTKKKATRQKARPARSRSAPKTKRNAGDPKGVQVRVAQGGDPPKSGRRAGVALARPGEITKVDEGSDYSAETKIAAKTRRRAVHAPILSPSNQTKED